MDMATGEYEIFGKVTSPGGCRSYGLRFPLSPGEAACLAMAVARGLPLVTDDGDALRALEHISRGRGVGTRRGGPDSNPPVSRR
jgi:hypothetical protein